MIESNNQLGSHPNLTHLAERYVRYIDKNKFDNTPPQSTLYQNIC